MDEGRRMRELHRHRGREQPLDVVLAPARGQKYQCRADSLAAGGKEVRHRRSDLVRVMPDPVPESSLDCGQVGSHRAEDVYVFCGSQIDTSSASIASPNRLAAISSNRCGTAVTRTS